MYIYEDTFANIIRTLIGFCISNSGSNKDFIVLIPKNTQGKREVYVMYNKKENVYQLYIFLLSYSIIIFLD